MLINTWTSRLKPLGEVNTLPSLVVPDQTISLKEILEKFTRGQMPEVSTREGKYHEEDLSEIMRMDTFEKLDLSREIKAEIQEARTRMKSPPQQQKQNQTQPVPSNATELAVKEVTQSEASGKEAKPTEGKASA